MNFLRNKVQNMNKILASLVLLSMTTTAYAQSSSNSPYSQFGVGDLAAQSVSFNKGMNGVGLGMRKGNEVNPLNPASYSAIDSLTMIFDGGLSGILTNYEENGKKTSAKSGGFDYFTTLFRVRRNLGVSVGVMPYSNVGYDYSVTETKSMGSSSIKVYDRYYGYGGLNQLYLGVGWRILKPLSVGVNLAYLWGDLYRYVETGTSGVTNTLYRHYDASVSHYKLDIGLQLDLPLGKRDQLTIGATFSPGHNLNCDPSCDIVMSNSTVSKADTTSFRVYDGLEIPMAIGVGLGYSHSQKLRVGADFLFQKWGSLSYPEFDNNKGEYLLKEGLLKDRVSVNVGAEYMPNPASRKLMGHIRYRAGVGYSTPYYYINKQNGPKEISASIGFGIPIANGYNNRSILSVSGQWVRRSADNFLTDNTFRISIGLTFNERWFAKWKVE